MTRHPQHLHATAELHSLLAAWPHLQGAVDAARAAAHDDGDLGTLRSPTYGSGRSGVIARSAIAEAVADPRRWSVVSAYERRQQAVVAAAYWLAERLAPGLVDAPVPDVLRALLDVVPRLPPTTAGNLGRHIADEDGRVRELLYLGTDHQMLPGVACPACGSRRLAVRGSAPTDRPVICEAGCACSGDDCRCGMGMPTSGVQHIWTRPEIVAAVRLGRRKAKATR